jgi:putative flippase GtrA
VKHLIDSESARPFRYLVTGGVGWLVDLAVDRSPTALVTQTLRYAALWALAYILSAVALVILIGHLNWNTIAAKFVVEVGIVFMNYTVMKSMIFLPPKNREKDE